MANIDQYLDEIEVASRGEEVRDSIIDAFEALNSEGPGTMKWDNITDTPDTLTGYGVSEVPASMVSGVLALNNIPPSALERMVPVADDTARFALTSSDVQNGDTVKVLSTQKLYLVVDDTSLSTEAGYEEYRAGTADSVDWSGVLNTPDSLAGYGIEDAYTKDEVDDITTSEEEESNAGNPITIETDAAQYAKTTHLTLAPIQDLHGYDHPWPAGGGKNLLPMTVDDIKTANTGTWSGNSITINGVTFTILTDSAGNITGIKANGTASGIALLQITPEMYFTEGQKLSGITNSTGDGIGFGFSGVGMLVTNPDYTISASVASTKKYLYVRVNSGFTANNAIFYPMIRLASESDATFAPYSNICPITPMGHRNLLAPQSIVDPFVSNGITFIVNADGSVTVNGTASSNTWLLIGTAHLTAGEKYILTGGIDAGRMMQLTDYPVVNSKGFDNGSYGLTFTAETNVVYGVRAYIASDVTVNNETLYPMIRPASDPDSTFVPYGMARVGAKVTGKNLFGGEANALFRLFIPSGTTVTASDLGGGNVRYYDAYQNEIDYWALINTESVSGRKYRSFTVSSDTYFVKFDVGSTTASDFQLEVGSALTSYEPYKGYTSSIDLPEEVYSGTLDLETGEVVSDMGMVEYDGSSDENWQMEENSSQYSGKNFYIANSSNIDRMSSHNKALSNLTRNITIYSPTQNYILISQMYLNFIFGNLLNITTIEGWRNYLASSPVQFAYPLATPKTYQLTPQQLALFKGTNNISTNAKTVQVTYRNGELATTGDIVASTEVAKRNILGESASYTDARLATELAPILGNFATAETSPTSASHAVGEYLLYNNRLYKVLAAISAGQQLTIGTNIGQTNVAAELTRLNSLLT